MKIVQITAVVENSAAGETIYPREDATIYGLGDDNRMYYWGTIKSTRIEHKTEEELEEHDYEKYHYDNEYGWKEVV